MSFGSSPIEPQSPSADCRIWLYQIKTAGVRPHPPVTSSHPPGAGYRPVPPAAGAALATGRADQRLDLSACQLVPQRIFGIDQQRPTVPSRHQH